MLQLHVAAFLSVKIAHPNYNNITSGLIPSDHHTVIVMPQASSHLDN